MTATATADPHTPAHIERLIARCLKGDPRPAVRIIEQNGLWEYVAARAWECGVGALMLRHLRSAGLEPPESTVEQLEAYREHVTASLDYSFRRTQPILARLTEESIPFLLLKGAALAASVYRDQPLRPMVDLDLLVREEDLPRIERIFAESGYRAGPELIQGDFFPRYHYEREYLSADQPTVKIDLHVRPFRPMRYAKTVPFEALWDSPTAGNLRGLEVPIPNPVNMLIHLAVHAACHGLNELRWLHDIQAWLDYAGDRIDIDELAAKCKAWRLSLPVQEALGRVLVTFRPRVSILPQAIRAVAHPANLFDRLALWQSPYGESRPYCEIAVNVLCSPGWRFRLGYLRAVLLPDARHLGQLYHRRHPGWTLMAHVVRLVRSVQKTFASTSPTP